MNKITGQLHSTLKGINATEKNSVAKDWKYPGWVRTAILSKVARSGRSRGEGVLRADLKRGQRERPEVGGCPADVRTVSGTGRH